MNFIGTTIQPARRRNVIRRNYRWLREDGVSRTTARLVISSTARVAILSEAGL